MLKILSLILGASAFGFALLTGTPIVHALQTDAPTSGQNVPSVTSTTTPDGRVQTTSDTSVSANGIKTLNLRAPIASVVVSTGSGEDLTVHAVRWTKDPASDAGKRWMSHRLRVTRVGDLVTVEDQDALNTAGAQDPSVGESAMRNLNGGLDLRISMPRNLNCRLHISAGTASTTGDFRSLDVSIGAGAVDGSLLLLGKTSSCVNVGAGDVKLAIPHGANLDVTGSTGMGDISGFPSVSEDPKATMHLGDHRVARIGAGGSNLSIHVGTGSISLKSVDRLNSTPSNAIDEAKPKIDVLEQDDARTDSDLVAIARVIPDGVAEATAAASGDREVQAGTKRLALAQIEQDSDLQAESGQDATKAMADANKALAEVGPAIEQALKEAQPEMDKALAELGPDIQKALKEMKPEIERALKQAQPEIRRELAKIRPEIERAMKEARPGLEKARNQKALVAKAMAEVDRSMREAEEALDRANMDMQKQHASQGELEKSIRETVALALKSAREAMKESLEEAKKAAEDAKKQQNP